jgi:WXG100 family type VII secretion target
MGSFGLNPNGLLDTADELKGIQTTLQNALDALEAQVNNFKTNNSGRTIASYDTAQKQWDAGMAEMDVALTNAQTTIVDIHDQYVWGDNYGASLFGGNV